MGVPIPKLTGGRSGFGGQYDRMTSLTVTERLERARLAIDTRRAEREVRTREHMEECRGRLQELETTRQQVLSNKQVWNDIINTSEPDDYGVDALRAALRCYQGCDEQLRSLDNQKESLLALLRVDEEILTANAAIMNITYPSATG